MRCNYSAGVRLGIIHLFRFAKVTMFVLCAESIFIIYDFILLSDFNSWLFYVLHDLRHIKLDFFTLGRYSTILVWNQEAHEVFFPALFSKVILLMLFDNKRVFWVKVRGWGILTLLSIIKFIIWSKLTLLTLNFCYLDLAYFVILISASLIPINCIEFIIIIDAEAAWVIIISFDTTPIPLTNLVCLWSTTLLHRELTKLDLGLIFYITWDYAYNKLSLAILTLDFLGLSLLIISWCVVFRVSWHANSINKGTL